MEPDLTDRVLFLFPRRSAKPGGRRSKTTQSFRLNNETERLNAAEVAEGDLSPGNLLKIRKVAVYQMAMPKEIQ
jgi:hypothetical protein